MAATTPDIPNAPIFISATDSEITFLFEYPSSTGGSPITGFKLYYDTIQSQNNYQIAYEGPLTTVTVSSGLTTGVIYRFVLVATNIFGDSIQSEEKRVALGFLPPAPNAPTKIEHLSTLTSMTVEWNRVYSTDGVPVIGYILFMDDGFNGEFTIIYDGSNDAFTT